MNVRRMWRAIISAGAIGLAIGVAAVLIAADTKEIPDHTSFTSCQSCHAEKHSMWEASGHSKAIGRVTDNNQASADCYGCHSMEGFAAKLQARKVDVADKKSFHSVSCLACHDPVKSSIPRRLVADPEKLCTSCHTQEAVIKGKGAKGIEETRSFHSAIPCVSCHMTGGNHLMKVIRPDDPDLSEKRQDTCTTCHKDNNRTARVRQIQSWQAEYTESMDALQADVKAISAALKDKPDLLNAGLKVKFSDAKSNLSILERDGSRGAHNFDYALEIMALAAADLKEVKAAIK